MMTLLKTVLDVIFTVLIVPAALLMRVFRRIGVDRLPMATRMSVRLGVFPLSRHFYDPMIDHSELRHPLDQVRPLPGIDMNTEGQLAFLRDMTHADELAEIAHELDPDDPLQPALSTGMFDFGDSEYLYQFIRTIRPKKIIEIGSGQSTKIAARAMRRSHGADSDVSHICFEPFWSDWLDRMQGITVVREKIETSDIDWHDALDAGDFLFIDSSHIIRPQGDVLFEVLNVLPVLKSGVYVHVHDIFTPRDYPEHWLARNYRFWNEQYLLEALLTDSGRYEVIGALNYLKNDHFDALARVCPNMTKAHEPASFYLRVR